MPATIHNSSILFPTTAIIGKHSAVGIANTLLILGDFLETKGSTVILDAETASHTGIRTFKVASPEQIGETADLVIVVGGDGTMLGIARRLAPYRVPFIGINFSGLGFMTDIRLSDMIDKLTRIFAGEYEVEQRSMLEGTVTRKGVEVFHCLALNDVVVARGARPGMIELKLTVNDQFMYTERSDGMIVSTPTGSTAYGLAAGGPVMHPRLGGIALTPIAPHALSNRPILVSSSAEIIIDVTSGHDVTINFDMQTFTDLKIHDCIKVSRSDHEVIFLHPKGWNYFETLRSKLHWNTNPALNSGVT